MSFQRIRGGKSLGAALEMFEYFKSGEINHGRRGPAPTETENTFIYLPAGTDRHHFKHVAAILRGELCEIRAHNVERDVIKGGPRNRRCFEFFLNDPWDKSGKVHFKLTIVQYNINSDGEWHFLAAKLTVILASKKAVTRYAPRMTMPEIGRPYMIRADYLQPFTGFSWVSGMTFPIYMVSHKETTIS